MKTLRLLLVVMLVLTAAQLRADDGIYTQNGGGSGGSGPANTDALAEGSTNLYFTNGRAQSAISVSVTGLTWSGGSLSLTTGYGIPTTTQIGNWNSAYGWGNHAGLYIPVGSAPSGAIVGTSGSQTLTNKRVEPRIQQVGSAASLTPAGDDYDGSYQNNTETAGTWTINNLTGTPVMAQKHELLLRTTNAQTFAFGNKFSGTTDVALPDSIGGGHYIWLVFKYNSIDQLWYLCALNNII